MQSPLAGWMGGKSRLSKEIIARMPDHECYCEPFCGAAWVLFRKAPSQVEVINDINSEVVTLYRVIRHHLREFLEQFRWILCAREEFQRFMDTPPGVLTDIQRAARFYYVQRLSFGGRVQSPTFGYSATRPARLNLYRIEEDLSAVHLRLARVYIEHLSYDDVIRRYDRPATLFYLDPPYFGHEHSYGRGVFEPSDFAQLRDILSTLQGRFILSLNDTPEIRKLFGEFKIDEVSVRYTCGRTNRPQVKELLISNGAV